MSNLFKKKTSSTKSRGLSDSHHFAQNQQPDASPPPPTPEPNTAAHGAPPASAPYPIVHGALAPPSWTPHLIPHAAPHPSSTSSDAIIAYDVCEPINAYPYQAQPATTGQQAMGTWTIKAGGNKNSGDKQSIGKIKAFNSAAPGMNNAASPANLSIDVGDNLNESGGQQEVGDVEVGNVG